MSISRDVFEPIPSVDSDDDFESMSRKPVTTAGRPTAGVPGVATARLRGFALNEDPLISDLEELPGEVLSARTTIPLVQDHVGRSVVVVFERGDARRPIVIGVLQSAASRSEDACVPAQRLSVEADDDRLVVSAEREIVLRCGEASITLTRAGKVLIKGKYVLSRSSGHNKIKGAAIDIN